MKPRLLIIFCFLGTFSALAMDPKSTLDSTAQTSKPEIMQKADTPSAISHTLIILNGDARISNGPMIQQNRDYKVPMLVDKKSLGALNINRENWTLYEVNETYNLAVPQSMLPNQSNLTEKGLDKELGLKLSTLKKLIAEHSSDSKPIAPAEGYNSTENANSSPMSRAGPIIKKIFDWKNADYGLEHILSSNFLPTEREKVLQLEHSFNNLGDIDLVKALSACLITSDDKQYGEQSNIPWNIILFGHGHIISSPAYSGQLPVVASLNLQQFKRFLGFLDTKITTLTLTYSSCCCGGPNRIYPFEEDGVFQHYNYFIISLGLSENFVIDTNSIFLDLSNLIFQLHQLRTKWKELNLKPETFSADKHQELLILICRSYIYYSECLIPSPLFQLSNIPFIRLIGQTNFLPLNLITRLDCERMSEWPSAVIINLTTGQIQHAFFGTAIANNLTLKGPFSIVRLAIPKFDSNDKIIGHRYLDSIDSLCLPSLSLEQLGNLFMPYCIPQVAGGPLHVKKLFCRDGHFDDVLISLSIDKNAAERYDRHQEKNATTAFKYYDSLVKACDSEEPSKLMHYAEHLAYHCLRQAFKDADTLKKIYPRFTQMMLEIAGKNKTCLYDRKEGPVIVFNDHALTPKSCFDKFKLQLQDYKNCSGREFTDKAFLILSGLMQEIDSADTTYYIDDDLELCRLKIKES